MKIAVLGSTGPTGAQIVRQAVEAGHEVTAVARHANAFPKTTSNLRVKISQNIFDEGFLSEVIAGVDCVLSALGSHQMRHHTTIYSAGAASLISAMHTSKVQRLICVSALPAMPDKQKLPLNRYVLDPILHQFFGGGYDDMRRMEKLLSASDIEWTVFRPPYLRSGPATKRYRVSIDVPLTRAFSVTRADLAAAMLLAMDDPSTFRHYAMIAN